MQKLSADGPPAVWHEDPKLQKALSAVSHKHSEGSQMLFYVWFEFTSWLRGVGQGKGAWDRFLTIWARQLCLCLYYNGKINESD